MCNSKARTSVAVNTTGRRLGFLACTTSSSQGKSTPSTCLYKYRIAALAWFWVDADTWRCTAKCVKNASTSAAPISCGWRFP